MTHLSIPIMSPTTSNRYSMHFAVHGQTAAEVIFSRADTEKKIIGLTVISGNQPHLKDLMPFLAFQLDTIANSTFATQ